MDEPTLMVGSRSFTLSELIALRENALRNRDEKSAAALATVIIELQRPNVRDPEQPANEPSIQRQETPQYAPGTTISDETTTQPISEEVAALADLNPAKPAKRQYVRKADK